MIMRVPAPYRFLAALSVAVAAGGLFAQGSGTVRMKIDPQATFEYVLDHRFRMRQPEVELGTGTHHFSIWAPQRAIVDTNVVVENGRTLELALRLPYAQGFLVYQRELQAYRSRRRVQRLVPAIATGGTALWAALSYAKMKKAHDRLEDDRAAYTSGGSPHQIGVLKAETIPQHKEDFKRARTQYGIAAGTTLLCAGATAYLFWRTGKEKKPGFIDTEKIRFDGLSWTPGPNGGTWQGGLTWDLTR